MGVWLLQMALKRLNSSRDFRHRDPRAGQPTWLCLRLTGKRPGRSACRKGASPRTLRVSATGVALGPKRPPGSGSTAPADQPPPLTANPGPKQRPQGKASPHTPLRVAAQRPPRPRPSPCPPTLANARRHTHQPSHHTRTAGLPPGPGCSAPTATPCPFRIMSPPQQLPGPALKLLAAAVSPALARARAVTRTSAAAPDQW